MIRQPIFLAILGTLISIPCLADDEVDVQALADAFASAVNEKDLEAVVSFWSEDAELIFLPGNDDHAISGRQSLRDFYEHVFESGRNETMVIVVAGFERVGDEVREWGSYKIGTDVSGCYVILRRKSDEWRIYREWLVEPCGE